MKYQNKKKNIEETKNSEIVELVVRLYLNIIKSMQNDQYDEINVLYSLLENLFADQEISWENYIREINKKEIPSEKIVESLNNNLITLDKIRILLGLIILANSDNELETKEYTLLLDLAIAFNLDPHDLSEIFNFIENGSKETASIRKFKYFNHYSRSIFKDYLVAGRDKKCEILFRNDKYLNFEFLLFVINKYIFIGTNSKVNSILNGEALMPNRLYVIPENSILQIGKIKLTNELLYKINSNKQIYDVIDFKKDDHDFKIINNRNRFSLVVTKGKIYVNGSIISYYKEVSLYFDDIIQIESYDQFTLLDVIKKRDSIGTAELSFDDLFINFEKDYFISKKESSKTIIHIENENHKFLINPPTKRGWDLYLNNVKVIERQEFLLNRDTITINRKNFKINSFFELIEIPFEIDKISFIDLKHTYKDGQVALNSISFDAKNGEFVAIMGKSGCGKSSLLKAISAEFIPDKGRIIVDGKNLFDNYGFYSQYIGYVPQDDLLFSNLTVYENLLFRAKLRVKIASMEVIENKINNLLIKLNLSHKRDSRVGYEGDKLLSGGERKRLNMALELLFDPTLLICDEPTSGLSSNDSEQIMDILEEISSQGKIVIISIHQPNQFIFEKFDKVLLLDKNGTQVFFGDREEAFEYFNLELKKITKRKKFIEKKKDNKIPDYFFDIIEYPVYNKNNELTFELINNNLTIKRLFPNTYWKNKFKKKVLFDLVYSNQKGEEDGNCGKIKRPKKKYNLKTNFEELKTFFFRNLFIKFRNKSNTIITFVEAPILAIIIAWILRLAPLQDEYSYYGNVNGGIYFFISIILFIFLGLSNSVEDIYQEKKIFIRERKLNIHTGYYLISKFITLSIFVGIQSLFYYVLSSLILGIKGMFFPNITYLILSGMIGSAIGLLMSSMLNNSKAITNILPLILIPQIIFGGAIIQFDKMNRDLKIFKKSAIPEVVQFIPSRWLFEGMFTAQAQFNTYDRNIEKLERKRLTLLDNFKKGVVSSKVYQEEMSKIYDEKSVIAKKYPYKKYQNEGIEFVVNMMEGKSLNSHKKMFLAGNSYFFGMKIKTFYYDLMVILFYLLIFNLITYIKLKFFYKE